MVFKNRAQGSQLSERTCTQDLKASNDRRLVILSEQEPLWGLMMQRAQPEYLEDEWSKQVEEESEREM